MTSEEKIKLLELKLNGVRQSYAALKKENKRLILLVEKAIIILDDARELLFDTRCKSHSLMNEFDYQIERLKK